MTTWILIMTIGNGRGLAIDHVEFNSHESCIKAEQEFKSKFGTWSLTTTAKTLCVKNRKE